MSFETQGNQRFWRDVPGAPEKFEKKKLDSFLFPKRSPAKEHGKKVTKKSEGKKYTPKVFSALKTQVPQQAKKEVWCIPKSLFSREKKENTWPRPRFLPTFYAKKSLKLGKMWTSRPKKHDQFWSSFLFLPFSLFASKSLKHAVFAFQKGNKVGRNEASAKYIYTKEPSNVRVPTKTLCGFVWNSRPQAWRAGRFLRMAALAF